MQDIDAVVRCLRSSRAAEQEQGVAAMMQLARQPDAAALADAGCIPPLVRLLGTSGSVSLRARTAAILCSLSACSQGVAALIGDSGAIPALVRLLSTDQGARSMAAGTLQNVSLAVPLRRLHVEGKTAS